MADQLKILLVDDNLQYVRRMCSLLEEVQGIHSLQAVPDFEEAVEAIDANRPDVVLLDIHLPGKNGLELLKYIKQSDRTILVMIVTNQADEYYRQLCRKYEADYFFDKSNDFLLIPAALGQLKRP